MNARIFRSVGRLSLLGVLCASLLLAQKSVALSTTSDAPGASANGTHRTVDDSNCPNQGGLLNSISVPVGQPLALYVIIGQPATQDEAFDVSSDNASIASAGDPTQGFLGTVTIPQGQQYSNLFTVIGNSIGQANIIIVSLSGDYATSKTPIGPWDVNPLNNSFRFVDANPPNNSCLAAGTANFSTSPDVLANCGSSVFGAASDGVTNLLLRTAAGIAGTACYAITSSSSLEQGTIQDAVLATELGPSSFQYAFTYYTTPAYYGDNSDSRNVNVTFTFTPSLGNGNTTTITAPLTVVRPPVMLLHGIWSNGGSWNSDYLRNDATHTTYAGDYTSTNASSFSVNESYVDTAINTVLAQFRQKEFAATQVDVIAHSMGGLLTRLYAGSNSFQRPDNYNKGDIHRLITLDTPHFGSSFANLLVDLHQTNPTQTESTVSQITGGSVTKGAVCDLAENSSALAALTSGTPLKAQVITASGGPAGTQASPASYWTGSTVFGIKSFESALTEQYCAQWIIDPEAGPVCVSYAYVFPQTTVDAFRFRQMNDAVVALSSQQGGLAGLDHEAYIHFHIPPIPFVQRGITDGSDVATQVITIMDGPDSGLVNMLPAVPSNGSGVPITVPGLGASADQKTYLKQCSPGGPLKPASPSAQEEHSNPQGFVHTPSFDPRVTLASPAADTIFTTGDTINIVVHLAPPLTIANSVGATLAGLEHVSAVWTSGQSFSARFVVPPGITGPLMITPDFTDPQGNYFAGVSILVGIKPAGIPQSIALQQHNFILAPTAPSQQLNVQGTYAGGPVLDLTSVFTGTSYASSNVDVATVTKSGMVNIVGAGLATITVKNGVMLDFATFVVQDPTTPLPPQDVTSQFNIQQGGFRLDRNTGFFVETVTLTNSSKLPVVGPLNFVVSGLPSGVTLVDKSGITQSFRTGSPYVAVPLSSDSLTFSANQSITLTLQFLNPQRRGISYSGSVVGISRTP